jgi:hypothetical protein
VSGLFGWGARGPADPPAPARSLETNATSVVLPRFLGAVSQRASPVLLDLGPAIGTNVTFLGERLGCKLLIGDLHHEITAASSASPDELRASLLGRLQRAVTAPLDGVLCWDLFDYLDRPTAQAIAQFLVGKLAVGGAIHGLFSTIPGDVDCVTRYVIQSPSSITCRVEPIAPRKRAVLSTPQLAAMFSGTKVTESVLLKNQRREILLRKG